MKPLLKWAGGKRRSASIITPLISEYLQRGGRYIEPFLGGGAIYLSIDDLHATAIINDLCTHLMQFYTDVGREPRIFFDTICKLLQLPFDSTTYYRIRDEWNAVNTGPEAAAQLWYLNKTGFNGLFRLNKSAKYNVPWGKYKKPPQQPSWDNIYNISQRLAESVLYNSDFSKVIQAAQEHDVIYVDPPYWNTYAGYTGKGFDIDQQLKLASLLYAAYERGSIILASNIDCSEVREAYYWADIRIVPVRHSISCSRDSRKTVDEVLMIAKR